jgi:hypothetical protein
MMVLHILELLLDGLFGEWEGMAWVIAASICDSLFKPLWNS